MTYTDVIYKIGDGIIWSTDILFEHVGNIFNFSMTALLLFGIVYWLMIQHKLNKKAENNPNQIK